MHTSDFSSSGLFINLVMRVLFCWQTQHKSAMGLPTRMCGRSLIHKSAKVVNATAVIPLAAQDSSYKVHTFCCKYASVNLNNAFIY